jgi:hypothetical protein
MSLEPYKGVEIRSNILGIPVFISENVVAKVLRRDTSSQYEGIDIPNARTGPWKPIVNETIFGNEKGGVYADLSTKKKMMLKIQNENLLPKGGGSDRPSLAHKVFLHHFINKTRVNVPKYIFRYIMKELKESQDNGRVWVPYGRLISEILHKGGILRAISDVQIYNDSHLGTVRGKVISGRTLRNMLLIPKDSFVELPTDLKESDAVSNLMENFPPICKKEPLDVQMFYIKEHYALTGKKIRLEDVPENMYGGALPLAKGRKSKRKGISEEEYLAAEEQPAKKAKSEKASKKLKRATSEVPSISKEVQDLDIDVVLKKKTMSGKVATSTQGASELPPVPKRKRKPAVRKIKESPYVIEEVEGVDVSTDLVIRELNKKKAEDAAAEALQKALELSQQIEVPASSMVRKDATVIAKEAIEATEDLQQQVTLEAENLMMAVNGTEDVQEGFALGPEVVVNVESDSTSSTSSSSTDYDDVPLGQRYPKLTKSQSTSTKIHKSSLRQYLLSIWYL